jgi:hypothetical protein
LFSMHEPFGEQRRELRVYPMHVAMRAKYDLGDGYSHRGYNRSYIVWQNPSLQQLPDTLFPPSTTAQHSHIQRHSLISWLIDLKSRATRLGSWHTCQSGSPFPLQPAAAPSPPIYPGSAV